MNKLRQFKFQGLLLLVLSLLMILTALFCKAVASPDYLGFLVFGTALLSISCFFHSFALNEKVKELRRNIGD